MTQVMEQQMRQLDRRINSGVTVELLWDPENNKTVVRVHDTKTGDRFTLQVPGASALDAFKHPYAWRR